MPSYWLGSHGHGWFAVTGCAAPVILPFPLARQLCHEAQGLLFFKNPTIEIEQSGKSQVLQVPSSFDIISEISFIISKRRRYPRDP
jgi:hypothetical protein